MGEKKEDGAVMKNLLNGANQEKQAQQRKGKSATPRNE